MDELKQLFERTMTSVIEFRLGLSTFEYKNKQLLEDWREFENELEVEYPIRGIEVKINGEDLQKWGEEICNDAIILEREIRSDEITTTLAGEPFRYKEMTFVYLFSILEDFGNSILEIKRPSYYQTIRKEGISWHNKITKKELKPKENFTHLFAKVFGLSYESINHKIINKFSELRKKRNNIVHKLEYSDSLNFKEDIDNIIVIMCYLYYINDNNIEEFSIFSWDKY